MWQIIPNYLATTVLFSLPASHRSPITLTLLATSSFLFLGRDGEESRLRSNEDDTGPSSGMSGNGKKLYYLPNHLSQVNLKIPGFASASAAESWPAFGFEDGGGGGGIASPPALALAPASWREGGGGGASDLGGGGLK